MCYDETKPTTEAIGVNQSLYIFKYTLVKIFYIQLLKILHVFD